MGKYVENCTKHEGPLSPVVQPSGIGKDCDKDECNGYKQGYCMFEGNLMEHLNDIKDEATCQLACNHVPGCKYYIYDKDEKDCDDLRREEERRGEERRDERTGDES